MSLCKYLKVFRYFELIDTINALQTEVTLEVSDCVSVAGDWDEEEELLETDGDGDMVSEATDSQDNWMDSDTESLPPPAAEGKGARGKGSKGGPRGKGWK